MRILIVGAGAVGQVYGRHLAQGGAQVTFFVKPKYEAEVAAGLTLYPLNEKHRPVVFKDFDVVTSASQVAERAFDQIWLCVASTAMNGTWLDELCTAAPKAVIISLQPGLDQMRNLVARFGKERVVSGLITLIAWQAPLPGEELSPKGVSYWFPPLSPNPFSGPKAAVRAIVSTLRKGGCPATAQKDTTSVAAMGESILQPLVAALEGSRWSFNELAASPLLFTAMQAAREGLGVAAALTRRKFRAAHLLARPLLVRVLIWVAPKVMPFDVERYFAYHFSKVGEQTRLILSNNIREAKTRGLPHQALDTLLNRLHESPQGELTA